MRRIKTMLFLLLFCSMLPYAATYAASLDPTLEVSDATPPPEHSGITPSPNPSDPGMIIRDDHLEYKISQRDATVISYQGIINGEISIPRTFKENNIKYTVVAIGENAFANQSGMTAISLPSSITDIGAGAFDGCTSLQRFSVPKGNAKYATDSNGLLYDKDLLILYRVPPAAETVDIPSTVIRIVAGAMQDCTQLKMVTIPEDVTQIDENVFMSSQGGTLSSPNVVVRVRPDSVAYQYVVTHGMNVHVYYQNGDCVSVDDESCDVRITSIDDGDGGGTVDYYHCPSNAPSKVAVPTRVLVQGVTYQVTGVAKNAFQDATNVRKIYINGEVRSVENRAFTGKKKKTVYITLKKGKSTSLQTYLDFALQDKQNSFYVKVPKGKYTERIRIYSNTTLDLRAGAVLKRTGGAGYMIVLGDSGSKYSAGHDITILGGVIDGGTQSQEVTTLCGFSHVKNVRIDGTTFKYLPKKKATRNAHMIEFGGSKNVLIKNCRFYGNKNHWDNNEAIQLESTYNEKKLLGYTRAMGVRDGTTCRDVTISKCYFRGFHYGCGSNHLSKKDHFTNMKFIGNTFVGASKYAICLYGYHKVTIRGNKLKKSGRLYQNQFSTGIKVN